MSLVALAARPGRRAAYPLVPTASDPRGIDAIELSYESTPTGRCMRCPAVSIKTIGRRLTLTCTECAIAAISFDVPLEEIRTLAAEFIEGGFFDLPFEANVPIATEPIERKLTYRDARRVHEVTWVDDAPIALLDRLSEHLSRLARTDYFWGVPTYEVLRTAIENRTWLPKPQSLAFLAGEGDELCVALLLDHNVEITDDALKHAAEGGNLRVAEMILAKVDPRRRGISVGTMLVAAARRTRWSPNTLPDPLPMVAWLLSQPGSAAYHDDAVQQAIEGHHDDVVQLLRRNRGK